MKKTLECFGEGCTRSFLPKKIGELRCPRCILLGKSYKHGRKVQQAEWESRVKKILSKPVRIIRSTPVIKEYRKMNRAEYHFKRDIKRDKYLDEFKIIRQRTMRCNFCYCDTNLTLDHIIPLSKGGEKIRENFQVLCKPCNLAKANKIIRYL